MNPAENGREKINSPLASFILIAYNQEMFIREALEGAFSQTYSPLEIILSDDASSDRTFEIMEEMVAEYSGPHQVKLNCNQKNLGLAHHVNYVSQLATGEILVLAAGDDISMPDRVKYSVDILDSNSDLNCVSFDSIKFTNSCDLASVDSAVVVDDVFTETDVYDLDNLIRNSFLHTNGATRAVRKCVFDYFGPLGQNSPTEDSTSFLRCLLLGKGAQVRVPLVFYRVHGNNLFASDNKYKFDYDEIHEQYLRDINTAYVRNDIKKEKKERLIISLQKRLLANKLRNKFHATSQKKRFFLTNILPCSAFRTKQKLRYFQKIFLAS